MLISFSVRGVETDDWRGPWIKTIFPFKGTGRGLTMWKGDVLR